MKLVRYSDEEREHYGISMNNKITCLPRLAKRMNEELPELLEDFITLGTRGVETAERLLEQASSQVNEVTFLAPIASPPKIVCLGLNYSARELH